MNNKSTLHNSLYCKSAEASLRWLNEYAPVDRRCNLRICTIQEAKCPSAEARDGLSRICPSCPSLHY